MASDYLCKQFFTGDGIDFTYLDAYLVGHDIHADVSFGPKCRFYRLTLEEVNKLPQDEETGDFYLPVAPIAGYGLYILKDLEEYLLGWGCGEWVPVELLVLGQMDGAGATDLIEKVGKHEAK